MKFVQEGLVRRPLINVYSTILKIKHPAFKRTFTKNGATFHCKKSQEPIYIYHI